MKIPTKKERPLWVFEETVKEHPDVYLTFVDFKYWNSLNREFETTITNAPTLIFRSDLNEKTYLSLWKCDVSHVFTVYGEEAENWKGKPFTWQLKDQKIVIVPIEEKIL